MCLKWYQNCCSLFKCIYTYIYICLKKYIILFIYLWQLCVKCVVLLFFCFVVVMFEFLFLFCTISWNFVYLSQLYLYWILEFIYLFIYALVFVIFYNRSPFWKTTLKCHNFTTRTVEFYNKIVHFYKKLAFRLNSGDFFLIKSNNFLYFMIVKFEILWRFSVAKFQILQENWMIL